MARNKITYGKVSISNVRTAITDYKKKYYLAMKRLMKDAAAVFVKTAVANVHVDTGMSAASLHPFGKKVGAPVLGSIIPKRAYRKGQTALSGRYYPKRVRSISEGEKAGKTAYEINVGSFERPYMSFRFQIKVWQYWYWEEKNWQSLNEASVDAEIFIDNNYEKYLPKGLDKVFKYGSPNVNY